MKNDFFFILIYNATLSHNFFIISMRIFFLFSYLLWDIISHNYNYWITQLSHYFGFIAQCDFKKYFFFDENRLIWCILIWQIVCKFGFSLWKRKENSCQVTLYNGRHWEAWHDVNFLFKCWISSVVEKFLFFVVHVLLLKLFFFLCRGSCSASVIWLWIWPQGLCQLKNNSSAFHFPMAGLHFLR